MKRASGVLLPVFSLPSKYGIGCFSKEAYKFIDQLKEAGQSYWQILPLGPTGYGDSPYQSFSTYAGNPYFIDLKTLVKEGLLTKKECKAYDFGDQETKIDYEKIYYSRFKVLKKAFQRFKPDKEYQEFVKENEEWLEDYSLYMAIKDSKDGASWNVWEDSLKNREPEALVKAKEELKDAIDFYKFQQYEFDRQWKKLRAYANKQGIQIVGDIPIYVAFDSADAWAAPELFQFDEENNPVAVAGCPPDAFSATGQLWGNPLYNWEYHKKTGYEWWIRRIGYCFKLYDVVRIDHFRGFDEYYAIPYGDETAVNGKWMPGPGMDLFQAVEAKLGRPNIIAEDLGFLTDSVLKMLADSGFPGMKVLQFAFDPSAESAYLPHTYPKNCVVYTGTHDNDTTRGWYHSESKATRDFAKEYMNVQRMDEDNLAWDFIRVAMGSVADLCITPMQDFLNLDGEARINMPSTLGGNWAWRMKKGQFDKEIVKQMARMTKIYGRLPVACEQ
nr:4-alpha-glucanotransferase [uncultured Mediterraneibacter sp.]